MKIVLMGPPGVGKGTQSELICNNYNIEHISTGNILRKCIDENTEVGKKIIGYNIYEGNFVPDDLVNGLIKDMKENGTLGNSYLLDGYPRTFAQALFYDNEILNEFDKYIVIYLNSSKEDIFRRISERRTCINCGYTYNLRKNAPKVVGVGDKCGSVLIQRADDDPNVFNKRLDIYENLTSRIVKYFTNKKVLFEVNASGEIDEVFNEIKKIIGEFYDLC